MNKRFNVKNILKWGSIAVAGVVALWSEYQDQKREEEYEEIKNRLDALEQREFEAE